jgi:adenine-specific DNA-methyltransferase
VDSTTGVQMAYVKQWAPRSAKPLELRIPELLHGHGRAIQGDAVELATASGSASGPSLGHFDLAYLDPPYNQHRYFTNYHVWETLVAWDAPEAYGVARKRLDARDPSTRSAFNSKRTMPAALASVVRSIDCELLVLSYNNESWLGLEELEAMCTIQRNGTDRAVAILSFDSARYVGARIGIFDPSGRKVGRVGHLSNQELLVIAGEQALVRRVVAAAEEGAATAATGAASKAVAAGLVDRLQQTT